MSKGGVSGSVSFPPYIAATHQVFLFGEVDAAPTTGELPDFTGKDVATLLYDALHTNQYTDGNPFDGQSYTNPEDVDAVASNTPIGRMRSAVVAQGTKVAQQGSESTLMDTWVTEAVARLDTSGVLNTIADMASGAIVATGLVMTGAQGSVVSPYAATTDWAAHWVAAKAKADLDLTDLVYSTIVVNAMDQADSIIINGIGAAMAGVDEGEVTAAIAAFIAANAGQRAEGIRQLSGSFADVNAVQTSAFMISLGLAKVAEQQNTASFQSQLRLGLYQVALSGYFDTMQSQSQVGVAVEGTNKAAFERVLSEGTNVMANLTAVDQAYRTAVVNAYVAAFSAELQQLLEAQLLAKRSRDTLLGALVQTQQNQMSAYVTSGHNLTSMQAEVERVIHALTWEYEGSTIDLEHLDAFWAFEAHQAANNILAAPAGMASALPPAKSKVGSAVSGALGGAIAGAPIPGIGPVVGAVMGGLAGLL